MNIENASRINVFVYTENFMIQMKKKCFPKQNMNDKVNHIKKVKPS